MIPFFGGGSSRSAGASRQTDMGMRRTGDQAVPAADSGRWSQQRSSITSYDLTVDEKQ